MGLDLAFAGQLALVTPKPSRWCQFGAGIPSQMSSLSLVNGWRLQSTLPTTYEKTRKKFLPQATPLASSFRANFPTHRFSVPDKGAEDY
ncbi:hypothetical protein TNCV_1666681 [Trichonephila clavipes]|nr:hypothetical protein TNCV_1666681 [Trichonephila clavipes]